MSSEVEELQERKKKFLWFAPVLVLPFVTLLFWALGGGAVESADAQTTVRPGLNTVLPDANLNNEPQDKLAYYDRAMSDSAKIKGQMELDPYQERNSLTASDDSAQMGRMGYKGEDILPISGSSYSTDASEKRVYDKLAQLNRTLNSQDHMEVADRKSRNNYSAIAGTDKADIDRLEQMMQRMNKSAEPDQEMNQLNGMLDKILDIQNPQRVQEQLKQQSASNRGQVFAVSAIPASSPFTLLESETDSRSRIRKEANQGNGFYSIENTPTVNKDSQNTIRAIVFGNQTVVSRAVVKLQLVNAIYINGTMIPKGEFIYGKANLNGERLEIKISSIGYHSSVYPVDLTVCDNNGLEGIYIPGAISRDVAKTSAEQGIQGIGLNTLDPSLGMQAASVGIEAAKSFLSKKVKLVSVTVKSDYNVLLRDEKQK